VRTNPPSAADFRSYKEVGIALRFPTSAEAERCYDGVSFSDTPERAAAAARLTTPTCLVATIPIADDLPVERTFLHRTGHYTVWAESTELLELVDGVQLLKLQTQGSEH